MLHANKHLIKYLYICCTFPSTYYFFMKFMITYRINNTFINCFYNTIYHWNLLPNIYLYLKNNIMLAISCNLNTFIFISNI